MYEDQTHLAERELASFISGVTELFGPEQARDSTEEWLDEAELMDTPPRATARDQPEFEALVEYTYGHDDAIKQLNGPGRISVKWSRIARCLRGA
jgi:hypothetical protein